MKLVDDKDMETMVALYFRDRSCQTNPIQLFAELVDVESTEDSTPLGEKRGVQDLCMVVLKAYVDKQLTVYGIDIDLNAPPAYENLNSGPHLQIHPVVIETDADGDYVYGNNGSSDHNVKYYSDLDQNEVPNDIDDKDTNDDGNVDASSIENLN
ncbi:hypothetical protein J1N35_019128 [Gossypium stocksii]|uniref:Uncharacterized protein n=1 Tax=Gossypium stocksii TaxID=47602 RepID=A0A9D4A7T6_9ROSI|nr:hypothetical protein J1N35_019128 [Gossypium stocksii]